MHTVKEETHIARQRAEASKVEQRVMSQLGMSLWQYTFYKYRSGLDFLDDYCGNDLAFYKMLECNKTFWGWWKCQWTVRDEYFLAPFNRKAMRGATIEERNAAYDFLNDARELLAMLKVPSVVVDVVPSFDSSQDDKKKVKRAVFGNHE